MNDCGNNLPFFEDADEYGLERVRFAVIKLSRGNIKKLEEWVQAAQLDWRDVLMAAGFGKSITAHQRWSAKQRG